MPQHSLVADAHRRADRAEQVIASRASWDGGYARAGLDAVDDGDEYEDVAAAAMPATHRSFSGSSQRASMHAHMHGRDSRRMFVQRSGRNMRQSKSRTVSPSRYTPTCVLLHTDSDR